MTFETFDQSNEGTLPDQKKTMTKTTTMIQTMTKTNSYRERIHFQRIQFSFYGRIILIK